MSPASPLVGILVGSESDRERMHEAVDELAARGIASEFEVRSAEPVEIGVDGEALSLKPPLRFVIRPGALTVRLPRTAPGRSPAARTVRVTARPTVTALWHTVLGRPIGAG